MGRRLALILSILLFLPALFSLAMAANPPIGASPEGIAGGIVFIVIPWMISLRAYLRERNKASASIPARSLSETQVNNPGGNPWNGA